MLKSNHIDNIYYILCKKLLTAQIVGNTRELNNVQLKLTNINNNIVSIRDISQTYLFGELLWYFTGRNSVDFIGAFGSMWKKISDDGKTSNSAYGYIMKEKHGFNQVDTVIELLRKDPNSRKAVINLNVPHLEVLNTKDEPCTIALQFIIRGGKLHCTGMMRSNDIWFGFPYDVVFFTELQKYIADKLKVKYGTYTHFAISLHMYDKDEEKIRKIINKPVSKPITFDRANFHENAEFIGNIVECGIRHNVDAKKLLLKLLDQYDIYKGNESIMDGSNAR